MTTAPKQYNMVMAHFYKAVKTIDMNGLPYHTVQNQCLVIGLDCFLQVIDFCVLNFIRIG